MNRINHPVIRFVLRDAPRMNTQYQSFFEPEIIVVTKLYEPSCCYVNQQRAPTKRSTVCGRRLYYIS